MNVLLNWPRGAFFSEIDWEDDDDDFEAEKEAANRKPKKSTGSHDPFDDDEKENEK
jgi:hypothetical protein